MYILASHLRKNGHPFCSTYIHSSQLTPRLDRDTKKNALENARFGENSKAGVSDLTLKSKSLFDLLVLGENLGVVYVAAAMKMSKNIESFFPAVLGSQPTRGSREEEEADEEGCARNSLDTPWNAEGGRGLVRVADTAVDEGTTVLDEVLDYCIIR